MLFLSLYIVLKHFVCGTYTDELKLAGLSHPPDKVKLLD